MTAHDLAAFSAGSLVDAYARGTLSPVEVLEATLAHAEAVNPVVNALFSIRPEEARAAARASEARWRAGTPLGPLDGVPTTVKDSVAMTGWSYFHGIGANRDAPASTFDSPPAARLKEGGAVIFAKTAMPDGGLLAAGVSSLFGVTRNPWGLAFNTGGSSSGAGASLACGLGCVSVGSDIAGSVRLPASHCGLAALKPTQGRIAHLSSDIMRSAGPMGRTVGDIAAMLTVIGQPDGRDAWCLPGEGIAYQDRLDRDLTGVRIGVLTDMGFGPPVEPAVRSAVEMAGRLLEGEGANVAPFISPFEDDAYAPIDLFLQVRGNLEYKGLPFQGDGAMNETVRAWASRAERHSAEDLYLALGRIARMREVLLAAFADWDYVIAPVLPVVAFPAEEPGLSHDVPLGHCSFTSLFNHTGQPASTVCMAFDERHLPIGVQVIGHRCDDLGVLQVTRVLESLRQIIMDWPLRPRA